MVRGIMTEDLMAFVEPETRDLYATLLPETQERGQVRRIHLVRKSAFAGVRPRRKHLVLTLKASEPIESERILKAEQASKRRWYYDVKLPTKSEIDAELLGWLAKSYDISG
jgi:Domain of unknown function (DUF5655)